jgi:hypothetical protein
MSKIHQPKPIFEPVRLSSQKHLFLTHYPSWSSLKLPDKIWRRYFSPLNI